MQVNPLDEALPIILEAVMEWKQEHTPEKLKAKVKRLLDQNAQTVTLKLLGFNDHWGEWALDHCNGRSGNSAAGDYLRKVQQEAIQEWMESISIPAITPDLKQKFKKEFQAEFNSQMNLAIWNAAQSHAEQRAADLITSITTSEHLDKYLQNMKLISPKGK